MIHEGHRHRLRNKFIFSSKCLEDHELLELLLFFSIPRRNTNETAHYLLERFGSLRGICDASLPSLKQVQGVGTLSAVLIKVVAEFISRYNLSAVEYEKTPLESHSALRRYLTALFVGTDTETCYLLLFDRHRRIISTTLLSTGTSSTTILPMQKIAELVTDCRPSFAVLAHNHPGGKTSPSHEDIYATNILRQFLQPLDIQLIDHFIVVGDACVPISNESKAYLYNPQINP